MLPLLAIEIFLAIGVFGLCFLGLAVGSLRGKPIEGSCGGLGKLKDVTGRSLCEACVEPCADLKREMRQQGIPEERIAELVPRSEDCEHEDQESAQGCGS